MKSAILENGKIKIVEKPKPALSAKGAVIKVLACGLCGSDIVKIKHSSPDTDPKVVLGHEVVGEIVEINTDIVGNSYYNNISDPFKKGDIVTLGHHYPCGTCDFCKNGNVSMCKGFKSVNISPAGFSDYIFVSEGHLKNTVFRLEKTMNTENASFMEPLSCCIRAIRRAGYEYEGKNPPHNAVVIGMGSIGLLMSLGLKAFGINAFGFDINPERQKFAQKFGINFDPNLKYNTVFMTSGSYKAIDTALELIKDGGKIVVFSSVEGFQGYKNNDIYYRELTVLGSYSPAPIDLALSFELLKSGKIDLTGVSTDYRLEDLQKAVDDTMMNKVFKACVKL